MTGHWGRILASSSESSEARYSGWCDWPAAKPGGDAVEVDGRGRCQMLQAGLGQTIIAVRCKPKARTAVPCPGGRAVGGENPQEAGRNLGRAVGAVPRRRAAEPPPEDLTDWRSAYHFCLILVVDELNRVQFGNCNLAVRTRGAVYGAFPDCGPT